MEGRDVNSIIGKVIAYWLVILFMLTLTGVIWKVIWIGWILK